MTRAARAGFTLIEVMIAVVIMAIGLSSLFASEAGAIRVAQRARTTTVATLLARCKMAEIEERIAKQGWPGSNLDDRDECCDGAEHDGYRCEWKVERIVLPDKAEAKSETEARDALDKMKSGASGTPGAAGGTPSAAGGTPSAAGGTPGGSDPLANVGVPLTGLPPILGGSGSPGTPGGAGGIAGAVMGNSANSSSGTGGDPLASMVMEFAFPIMKPVIEEQVRRATVTIRWHEGDSEQSFDLVQFLVNELPILNSEEDTDDQAPTPGAAGAAAAGSTGAAGSSTSSGTSTRSN
jgi:general secretion pathway protein I